jgi:hypothetical protein
MSTFRAFQTGLEAGQQQAKTRRQDDARRKATEAYGMGNYEGAVTGLMSEGLTDEASNFNTQGQQAQTRKQQQGYATALGSTPDRRTGMQNLRTSAMQAGDPNTMMAVDEALKSMDADQAAQFGQGMEFLGQTALSLKGVAPEARGQAAIEAIQNSPYANPQILAQIQQAAADGKITDDELDNFAMQTMSVADRVKAQREAMPEEYTLSPGQVRMRGDQTVARGPEKTASSGINLTFGEDGGVSGLSIGGPQMQLGGTGTKGNEPAVVAGPSGEPRVSPGQQQLSQNKDWQRIQSQQAQSDLVRGDVKKAIGLVKNETTGALASSKDLPFFGGSTDSGRLANALATIKANVGFDNLQTMRENSPTGGALGAVTEKEIAFLQAMQGSLEQSQTAADLKANLQRLDQFFEGREQRRREAFAQDYPDLAQFAGFAQRTAAEVKRLSKDINKATAEYNALPSGASYIDDDGIQRTKK